MPPISHLLGLEGPWVPLLVFFVALVYATVGHGGASGQLAVLSLTAKTSDQVATTALLLNLVVASIALAEYARAGHFRWSLTWPFASGSVPLALLGAYMRLPPGPYFILVGSVLLYAGVVLLAGIRASQSASHPPRTVTCVATGAGIGLISGMVGVGGGIFLSPVMMIRRWADAKQVSATSAAFIVLNSVAALLGRSLAEIRFDASLWPLVVAGVLGGLAGGHLGARRLRHPLLARVLGVVLLFAGAKLILRAL